MQGCAGSSSFSSWSDITRIGAPGAAGMLAELLLAADSTIKRGSLVFVLSDFISQPGWAQALGRLARRHEVLAVRLYDPAEMVLPDVGLVPMKDVLDLTWNIVQAVSIPVMADVDTGGGNAVNAAWITERLISMGVAGRGSAADCSAGSDEAS